MILITGASSGIGEATARLFAKRGRGVVLVARRRDRLERLAGEISSSGVKAIPVVLDVSRPEEVERFASERPDLLGQVTVLVNNAGLAAGRASFPDVTRQQSDLMIDTNLRGLLAMTHAVLPHFLKKDSGHIVNLGSVAGRYTYPQGNIYCATKAAVRALNEALRLDLSGTSIRVTEISPGMVETEFSQVRLGDAQAAKAVYHGLKPLNADDIAEAIAWSVERPPHVNIQEIVLYPTDQASPTVVSRKRHASSASPNS